MFEKITDQERQNGQTKLKERKKACGGLGMSHRPGLDFQFKRKLIEKCRHKRTKTGKQTNKEKKT